MKPSPECSIANSGSDESSNGKNGPQEGINLNEIKIKDKTFFEFNSKENHPTEHLVV